MTAAKPQDEALPAAQEEALPAAMEAAIAVLCMDLNLSHIFTDVTAESLRLLLSDRPAFLAHLKQLGVRQIRARQDLANGLAKLVRDQLWAPSTVLPPSTVSPSASAALGAPPQPPPPLPQRRCRFYALSDVHTDHAENMAWCESLALGGRYARDVLLLAGDVAHDVEVVRRTLRTLKSAFGSIFFTPGNHDLWLERVTSGADTSSDSMQKLQLLQHTCDELGVSTAPQLVGGAIVVPLLSWHHASWDTEPEVVGWEGIPTAEECMTDYHATAWPSPLRVGDEAVARAVDALNDRPCPLGERVAALRAQAPHAPIISFSHFLPRVELCPEKRFLVYPSLAKAVGSRPLMERVEALQPAVHVFGHVCSSPRRSLYRAFHHSRSPAPRPLALSQTHFGWDATLDGVRYLQAPLSYPEERRARLASIRTGGDFPSSSLPAPLLVYDSAPAAEGGGFPRRYNAAWSNFYARYARDPTLSNYLPSYSAHLYKAVHGVGQIGWGPGIDRAWGFAPLREEER